MHTEKRVGLYTGKPSASVVGFSWARLLVGGDLADGLVVEEGFDVFLQLHD